MNRQTRGRIIILISVLFAAILMIIKSPLSNWLAHPETGVAPMLRPEWLMLVCVYWAVMNPIRFSVLYAWAAGLTLDLLSGSYMGKHGLALVIVTFIAQSLYQQIRSAPLPQQALLIGFLAAIYRVVIIWIDGTTGQLYFTYWHFAPAATSAVAWAPVFTLLTWQRHRHSIV